MNNKKDILVIDDSISTREFIGDFLEEAGYIVTLAADGQEALNILSKKTFNLIITDLLMPNIDGIEFLEEIQKLGIKPPVIVISADIQEETKNECFNLGVKQFINKPILNHAKVIDAVSNLLNS